MTPHRAGRRARRVHEDAPCYGDLGTMRRHPDARWRLRLNPPICPSRGMAVPAAGRRCRAGPPGRTAGLRHLLPIEPEENEQVVDAFVSRHPEFHLSPPPRSPGGVGIGARGVADTRRRFSVVAPASRDRWSVQNTRRGLAREGTR